MITDFLLGLLDGLFTWALGSLPDSPFPQGFTLGWISDINYFLPVTEMYTLFVLFFALGGPFVASSLIIWFVVGIIRGGATKA